MLKFVREVGVRCQYEVLTTYGWVQVVAAFPRQAVERLQERGHVVVEK